MILLLIGCSPIPNSVVMTGTLWDGPAGYGAALPDATIDILDVDHAPFDSAVSVSDGTFSVAVPAGEIFFATVSADTGVPTAFSGTAGVVDFTAPEGFPWVASAEWMAGIRAEFAGCPGVDGEGSVAWGEVVVDGAGYPVLSNAAVRLLRADDEVEACYLDEDGVYDPEATTVGAKGRFAIFGLEAEEVVIEVRYTDASTEQPVTLFRFLSPTDGLVPLYPAIIPI